MTSRIIIASRRSKRRRRRRTTTRMITKITITTTTTTTTTKTTIMTNTVMKSHTQSQTWKKGSCTLRFVVFFLKSEISSFSQLQSQHSHQFSGSRNLCLLGQGQLQLIIDLPHDQSGT